jgi:hypothetical protein
MTAARALRLVIIQTAIIIFASAGRAKAADSEKPLLRIQGGYLAHSYDFNLILGENIAVEWGDWTMKARSIKIDVLRRLYMVFGNVILTSGAERVEADEFFSDVDKSSGILVRYGSSWQIEPFRQNLAAADLEAELHRRRTALTNLGWEKIFSSLLYATARTIEITRTFEVRGTDVTFYVEGVPSVGFSKFTLAAGDVFNTGGISLDKIWYTRNQGLFGDVNYSILQDKTFKSLTQFHYEEHSILKDYNGLPRQLDVQNSSMWSISDHLEFGLNGNYNSTSLWNARFSVQEKSRDGRNAILLDASYQKPLQSRGESWFGLESNIGSDNWGNLSLRGRYEVHDQKLIDLTYDKTFGKRLTFHLNTNFSQLGFGTGGNTSKILIADANFSYKADLFQAAADYYLNNDLLGGQRLERPQLRFSLAPVTFYDRLLTATLFNVFVVNSLHGDRVSESYNDNTVFSLSAAPIWIRPTLSIQISLDAEQFLEKEGRNFTTGGTVLRAIQQFAPGIFLEAFYSFQSRRRTQAWLIEGTTSQDLSVVFRANTQARINGWVSVSYDPKYDDWKQGFAGVSVNLIRNWKIQSLINYDFYRNRLANIDLFLVRRAGRFDLRLIWRSLSKELLIELVPSM